MRIVIIVNHFPVLSESFVARKVLALKQRNHEVIICAATFNEALYKNFFSESEKIKVVLFNKKNFLAWLLMNPLAALRYSGKELWFAFVTSTVNKCRPDILHFEFSGLGAYYLPLARNVKCPMMVSCHGTGEKVYLSLYEERQKQLKELFGLVHSIHCVSNDLKNTIAPYCNEPGKIFINHTSIPVDYFKRKTEYVDKKNIMILSVGRLHYIKGYLTGLLAMRELVKHHTNIQWIIVGEGKQRKELSFHIFSLGLQQHVQLAGSKSGDELLKMYDDADIFLLPSISEGVSTAALEAMSMELPVVSTRCGGMPEIITHNENGLLADLFDYKDIAAQLQILADDFALRKKLGQAARQYVESNLTLNKQTDKFEQKYEEEVKRKN